MLSQQKAAPGNDTSQVPVLVPESAQLAAEEAENEWCQQLASIKQVTSDPCGKARDGQGDV